MKEILKYVIIALTAMLVVMVPLAIINGWVISWLWLWFLVPLGIPGVNLVHAIGLGGLLAYVTHQYVPDVKDDDKAERLAFGILRPFIALGIGYVVHSFM